MAKYLVSILSFSLLNYNVVAQQNYTSFTLNGTINADSGKVVLIPVNRDSYYSYKLGSHDTKVEKGRFIFTGSILYPYAFQIGLKISSGWKYISDIFFIDTGIQSIVCNVDSLWEIPAIENNSMREFKENYLDLFTSIKLELINLQKENDHQNGKYKNNIPDSLLNLYSMEKSRLKMKKAIILLNYAKQHPYSYVALWNLIKEFSDGYEVVLDSVYAQFADAVKNCYSGRKLAKVLSSSRITAKNNLFPELLLLNEGSKKVSFLAMNRNNKYTLIDFWFSHCNPCIAQFSELKKIYTTYKSKGFNIVAISTDAKKYVKDWRVKIEQYGLPWKQYLDLNGYEANKLAINKFPTNFLIDKQGKIIAKDIELSQLRFFLDKN